MKKAATVLAISFSIVLLSSTALAAWSIDPLSPPHDREKVSDHSRTIQMINLTDSNDDPVNQTELEEDPSELSYIYNQTGGSEQTMEHLHTGYYYANFRVNSSRGLTTEYQLTSSQDEVNVTETQQPGNMSVDLLTDLSDKVDPNEEIDIRANVTDYNESFEDQADLNFYVTNVSWSSPVKDTIKEDMSGNGEVDHYKNLGQNFNLEYSSKYIFHITASNSSLSYGSPFGARSVIFETVPRLDGEIEYLNSTSCQIGGASLWCERGAKVETGLNITSSNANKVNMTLLLKNKTSDTWENHTEYSTENTDGLYRQNFTVPDINTTAFEEEFRVKFDMYNSDVSTSTKRDVKYLDFNIDDTSSSVTTPPTYNVRMEATRGITLTPLEENRLNGYVNITDPDGEQYSVFNLSDMAYDEETGIFSREVDIPFDAETGVYTKKIFVENVYDSNSSLTRDFRLENISRAFDVEPKDIEKDIVREKVYNASLNFTNFGAGNITPEIDEELEDFTTVNGGSPISIDEDQNSTVEISFNVTDVEDYDGEIEFVDNSSSYSETVDVEIGSPLCQHRNGSYCAAGSLETEADEKGSITETLTFNYLGPADDEETITPTFSGNVSELVEIEPGVIQVNSENSTFEFTVNYSVNSPGEYEGDLEIGELEVPVSLDSEVEPTEVSISAPDSIDLGVLPEGGEKTVDIEIENTGPAPVTELTASSSIFEASIDSETLPKEETKELSLSISGVTGPGIVELEASNGDNADTETLDIEVETITDLAEESKDLQERLSDLDSEVDSPPLQTQLDEASTKITEVETSYNQENYEEAQKLYEEVSDSLNQIESESSSASTDPITNRTRPGPQEGPETDKGTSIIPIIAGIFIILLIGFVAFTSIVPERGDPLYNVLGK